MASDGSGSVFTYSDVSAHKTKDDLYVVVHDKVYDASTFVDEHPGGEEVLLDVAGQDATENFEDVGHSDEARQALARLLIGTLQRQDGDPVSKAAAPPGSASTATRSQSDSAGLGVALYAVVLVGGVLAYGAYRYLQASSAAPASQL